MQDDIHKLNTHGTYYAQYITNFLHSHTWKRYNIGAFIQHTSSVVIAKKV